MSKEQDKQILALAQAGLTQSEIAKKIIGNHGKPVTQGYISQRLKAIYATGISQTYTSNSCIFETAFQNQRQKNLASIVKEANSKNPSAGFFKKIKTLANKSGLPEAVIHSLVQQKDPLALAAIAKDPKKQNKTEDIVIQALHKQGFIDAVSLPQSGPKAYYIGAGVVSNQDNAATTKSVDIMFTVQGFDVYITHKYTKEGGGHQNQQFADAEYFIQQAIVNTYTNKIFLAVLDGQYYKDNYKKQKYSRLDYLNKLCRGTTNVAATDIYGVNKVIADIIAKLTA